MLNYFKKDAPEIGREEITIEGMHCENCQISIERVVNNLPIFYYSGIFPWIAL